MAQILYKKNGMLCVDESQLAPKAKRQAVINALYLALFLEFRGASKNVKYKQLTHKQRMEQLNQFAEDWLTERKLV